MPSTHTLFVGCFALLLLSSAWPSSCALTLVMMGSRRAKPGSFKNRLNDEYNKKSMNKNSPMNALNNGRGQEITGVSLPAEGTLKGWEFGNNVRMACANVNGNLYALQGACPRCAFDLFKGDLITDPDSGWKDLPRVACPTCATTYSLKTGQRGPPLKRTGLAGFVGGLAKTATINDEYKDANAFIITRDEDGRVYCKER